MKPAKKRQRWLNKRRRKGLERPLPFKPGAINGQGVTARPAKTARIIRTAASGVDLLTMCEVANIDVAKVLGREWDVAQDTSSWAKAGSAVAVRRERGRIKKWKLRLGVLAYLRGRRADRMQNRYIVRAKIRIDPGTPHRWTCNVAAGHAPPKRNFNPWWRVWMAVARSMSVHLFGADWNMPRSRVRDMMGKRKIRMRGIDGFVIRRWIPVTKARKKEVGSDHPFVWVTLWPKKRKKKKK